MRRTRLDVLMVERGLAPSRERARALILGGHVRVNGQVVSKAGAPVATDADVVLSTPDHPYVGRGGIKLAHALDCFGIDARGVRALDIGASTGGFTDVLLQRGAASVIAIDVGHNQLDYRLRTDSRVTVHEGVNARSLTADVVPHPVDLVTIDVSFISLTYILPAVGPFLTARASIVALVKPQFEAGRQEVGKGGLVTDPAVHEAVVQRIITTASDLGLMTAGRTASPITGATGNREFFVHLRPNSRAPSPGPAGS
jgi:23S rRNA (cytidine1920-2'-O)/16S rRNA (cytidine1409-2'-O)-methyltransferase